MYAALADLVKFQQYITQEKRAKVSVEIRVILCRTSVYRLMTPLTVVQCSNDL
jgi:hypothetical protein